MLSATKRRGPGKHLVDDNPEREKIGTLVGAFAGNLLGRHVFGRSENHAGHGLDFVVAHPRDAEIGNLDQAIAQHHDVSRFDVAVNNLTFMGEVQCVGNLRADVKCRFDRDHCFGAENAAQLAAFEVFHCHIGQIVFLAYVVDRDDIGVRKLACRFGFLVETCFVFRRLVGRQIEADRLDRDNAIEQGVARLVDGAHGALPKFFHDFVTAQFFDHC